MGKSDRTKFIGLDVHKESIATAQIEPEPR